MKTRSAVIFAATGVVLIFVLLTSFKYSLSIDGRAIKSAIIENDTVAIFQLLSAVEQCVRSKDYASLARALSIEEDSKNLEEPAGQHLNEIGFHIKQVDLRFVKSDSAVVVCDLSDYETLSRAGVAIPLKKEGRWWRIGKNAELTALLSPFIKEGVEEQSEKANSTQGDPEPPNSSSVIAQILIPEKHPGTRTDMNIYVINQSLTRQYMDANLFCPTSKLDMDVVTTDLSGWEVGFTLDHVWHRIVYGWQRSGDRWLKSYGDNLGDYGLILPKALAIDPFDNVFVADEGRGKIIRLFYDRNNRLISFVSEITIPGITSPCDVSYDQGNNVCDPNDDGIWVADYLHGQLVMIDRSGNVVKRITHYDQYGTVRPLRPAKVVASRFRPLGVSGPYIGVLCKSEGYWPVYDVFVTLDAGAMNGTTAPAFRRTAYGDNPDLVSLGIDVFGQFWIGDNRLKQYHTYSKKGDYLASYASNPSGSPVSISRTREHFSPGCTSIYPIISIHTADPWGPSTGLNYFLPGADIVNLSATPYVSQPSGNEYVVFAWTATNKCYSKVEVIGPSGNVLSTIQDGEQEAGHYSAALAHNEMPYGDLTVRAWVKPYYDHLYPHPSGWTIKPSIPFHNHRPISNVSVYEMIPSEYPGYHEYVASASGGDGAITYIWSLKLKCCNGGSFDQGDNLEPTCNWQNGDGFEVNNAFYLRDPIYSFWLKATAYDALGYYKSSHSLYKEQNACLPVPGGGCPFVFTWNGQRFVEDNNILPQSELAGNNGVDVTDRYKLMQPLIPKNNQYLLQIREVENEHSYLDQVKLIVVDHPRSREVLMKNDGEVIAYEKPFKLKHAKLRGRDVLKKVKDFDSVTVAASAGAMLDFGVMLDNGGGHRAGETEFSFDGTEEGGVIEGAGTAEEEPVKSRPLRLVETNPRNGEMTALEGLQFRRNPSLVAVSVALNDSSNLQLVWSDSVALDYINLARVKSDDNIEVYDLPLQQALYDGYTSVMQQLAASDSTYAELTPVHFIELRFAVPSQVPNGKKRTFFLVSKGRYERIPDSTFAPLGRTAGAGIERELPTVLALQQNYPNPFNPTTTIRVDLPQPENVKVSVYDILGREVVMLADGTMPAGYHSLQWYGTNSQGNPVSSGIYFVKMRVDDGRGRSKFTSTKKMLLTK